MDEVSQTSPVKEPVIEIIEEPEIVFEPEYTDVVLTARVQAEGAELKAGQFTFCVYGGDGREVLRAVNDRTGVVTFPTLRLAAPGTYSFNICQPTPSGFGWIIDRGCFPVEIAVDDAGGVKTEHPDGEALFFNRRGPSRRRV